MKLHVHHARPRFASILGEAKKQAPYDFEKQVLICKRLNEDAETKVLCRPCHAVEHDGERVHGWLVRSAATACKVCDKAEYCKGFCLFCYGRFRRGIYGEDGTQLRELCKPIPPRKCRKSIAALAKPKAIEPPVVKRKKTTCKVCGGFHMAKGFCSTHYNRFRIHQIDADGHELRHLQQPCGDPVFFVVAGKRMTVCDLAATVGIDKRSMWKRIRKWGLDRAVSIPPFEAFRR